jgi:hypothetical protein
MKLVMGNKCENCCDEFHTVVFCITKSFNKVHFYDKPGLPEVDVTNVKSLGEFCSAKCRDEKLEQILTQENVRVTQPDIIPIEVCSSCGCPDVMSDSHLTYVVDTVNFGYDPSEFDEGVLDANVLAVVCSRCEQCSIPLHNKQHQFDSGTPTSNVLEGLRSASLNMRELLDMTKNIRERLALIKARQLKTMERFYNKAEGESERSARNG